MRSTAAARIASARPTGRLSPVGNVVCTVHPRGATSPIESIQTGKNAFITSPMTPPSKITGIHLSSVISPLSLVSNFSNLASNRSISRFAASSA